MLADIQCLKLKNAGFPQPEIEVGQTWHSPKGECWIMNYQKSNLETLCDIAVPTMPSLFLDRHFDKSWIYCPTVADMLSLLKPEYFVRRSGGESGGWELWGTGKNPVFYNLSLIHLLYESWILRRDLFEKGPSLLFACPPKPKTAEDLQKFLYSLVRFLESYPYVGSVIDLTITPLRPRVQPGKEILLGGKKFRITQTSYLGGRASKNWCSYKGDHFDIIFALEDV